MLNRLLLQEPEGLRAQLNNTYRVAEEEIVVALIQAATLPKEQQSAIQTQAYQLIKDIRSANKKQKGIDAFLTQYALSSEEGIALMCLAEALLRIPDKKTIDDLIKDKLSDGKWHLKDSEDDSFWVNATTWGLMITGKILAPEKASSLVEKAFLSLVNRSSEAFIRKMVHIAMRMMSKQFIMGQTIEEGLAGAQKKEALGYRYSYDMLGEAALSAEDAERYYQAYYQAIEKIGKHVKGTGSVYTNPGISIKLSALHPRYTESQSTRVIAALGSKLLALAQLAKKENIALTVDAEECERLELSLDIIEYVFNDRSLDGWEGFGIAVQSYQKRAFYLLDWIEALAKGRQRRIMVRLIKGAYWDSEIKKTQMQGLCDYPVFTRKVFTDVSFQACAKKLLTMTKNIYPQFATHNAYTVTLVLNLVGDYRDFEFQCLHGMGAALYEHIVPKERFNIPCRIYAPIGGHEDLLPYLVRRLLENGANSSFVNRIVDEKQPIEALIADPIEKAKPLVKAANPSIPLPAAIFYPVRANSQGLDWTDRQLVAQLQQQLRDMTLGQWQAMPIMACALSGGMRQAIDVYSPQKRQQKIGSVIEATVDEAMQALTSAVQLFNQWCQTSVKERAEMVRRFAALLEQHRLELMVLAVLEAGKTWVDALAEVREAIDFCYYYAEQAISMMEEPIKLKGYTGETNELSLHPRGTILCISPWNFPLAIFTGQIIAALVTGNCVLAKPAEQTPLIAYQAVTLLLKAGVPKGVIQLLPGKGEDIGASLVADRRVKGVMFTGSTDVAAIIHQTLANRGGEIIPLIAETGGQNTMIVDSSALLEQVVVDVLASAFGSAGQRCSALRAVYIQEEVYERFVRLLQGAMAELHVGDPQWLATDVGPVIDKEALNRLKAHVEKMKEKYPIIYQTPLTIESQEGYFIAPTAIAIDNLATLKQEVFGPILHVMSFKASALDDIVAEINSTGYGLTCGIHSRINQTVERIKKQLHVGNCYVNRNMTGAIVGLQPFGGEGLSGTGPKAGGPHYLYRLCHERVVTIDTTAAGGNASLMSMGDE